MRPAVVILYLTIVGEDDSKCNLTIDCHGLFCIPTETPLGRVSLVMYDIQAATAAVE